MKSRTKLWLITATLFVLLGGILFAGVMATLNWDFTALATVKYETNTYNISEAFNNISINTDTADIILTASNDGKCRVECHEEENIKHSVAVKDGTLTIKSIDERKAHDFLAYIGINFDSPKITVYLTENEYTSLFIEESTGDIEIPKDFSFDNIDISLSTGDVNTYASACDTIKIKTSTGDIRVANINAGALDLSVSTGEVKLANIECKNLVSSGSTGDISLESVIAAEKISIERSTGDVSLDGSDAAEIFIKTDTGDVTGSLLTDKVFTTKTDTGDIEVPKSANGGSCEIITDTGDIELDIK